MPYYIFYRTDNGTLVSDGSVVPANLPSGVEARDVGERPDYGTLRWDAPTKTFVARPAPVIVDRVDDLEARFMADPDFAAVWAALNTTRRTQLRTGIRRVLASVLRDMRFRDERESVEI